MVNLERKFDILHHSIANFTRWIDSSTSLLKTLSDSQTGLESGQQGKDDSKLRDLALQYKDLLLKVKKQCGSLQEITTLCKEIKAIIDKKQLERHAKAYETVNVLGRRFSALCATAKQQYSQLASLLQTSSGAKISPGELKIIPPSFSPTPTFPHRVVQTPPPSKESPSSSQTHHRALSGGHYQPVFVRPTTFSLDDLEREEEGEKIGMQRVNNKIVSQGLKFEKDCGKSYDNALDSVAKAPVRQKPKTTKMFENVPKETKPSPSRTKGAKKTTKNRHSGSVTDETDPIPEILSLEGSPVIPGRRMFKIPSQESLYDIMGQTIDGRGSPVLPTFRDGSPNQWIEQPGGRVKVLPTVEQTQHQTKSRSSPSIVKSKPTIPKKPQFLKQDTPTDKQHTTKQQQQVLEVKKANEKDDGEKTKTKKSSRFPKLYGFGTGMSPKKTRKDGSRDKVEGGKDGVEMDGKMKKESEGGGGGRGSLFGDGKKKKKTEEEEDDGLMLFRDIGGDREVAEWDGPTDGRESPILQGRRGVKVMLMDDNLGIPAPPRNIAESATRRRKTPPPPVAKKPVGLMERITTDRKASDQSAKTHKGPQKDKENTSAGTAFPKSTKLTHPATPTKPTVAPSNLKQLGKSTTQKHDTDVDTGGNLGNDVNSVEEARQVAGSQNKKPQQLRVSIYKLDGLADKSVPVGNSSIVTATTTGGGGSSYGLRDVLSNRSLYTPERGLNRVGQSSGCVGGVQSSSVSVSDSVEWLQRERDITDRQERYTSGISRDTHTIIDSGREKTVLQQDKDNIDHLLDPASGSEVSDTNMERGTRYDRLGMGPKNGGIDTGPSSKQRGYDHLASKKNQWNGSSTTSEQDAEDESGCGQTGDGRSYYIGGRGRQNSDLSPPLTTTTGTAGSLTLKGRLKDVADQLQTHIHAIAEREKSSLQSLELELHMGEVKVMLTLLEVQGLELVRLRANFSPTSKKNLSSFVSTSALRWPNFPPEEIQKNKEEIVKLSERLKLLEKHCIDSISQIDEVMEFVLLFEDEMKVLTDFLSESKDRLQLSREIGGQRSEEAWEILTETLAGVNGQRTKLSSIEQLSNHLLYLEPIFDGESVRGDMHHLSTEYQGVILEVFSQLEALAHVQCEQLLMEMAVVSSWTTEAGLAVQALTKRSRQSTGVGDRIAASKESLESELKKHKTILLTVTKELEKITAVLIPDDHDSLRELIYHVSQASKAMVQIENGLSAMEFGGSDKTVAKNGAKSVDADYVEMSDLEESLKMMERKPSRVLPPVPVRNVNGAKANVKESDYAHIEDLNVHGHTPKLKRKISLLKPYAQVSMKDTDALLPIATVSMDTTSDLTPPPIPSRPVNEEDERKLKSRFLDLKDGQSIRDLPLPPRPDERGGRYGGIDRSPSPSPLPPPTSDALYDTLPKHSTQSRMESDSLYDVPRSLRQGESYDVYDVPKSLLHHQQHSLPEIEGTLKPWQPTSESHDIYDIPRSLLDNSYDLYDVPRTLTRDSTRQDDVHNVPRKTGLSDQEQVFMSSPDDSTPTPPALLYDVPRALKEGQVDSDSGQEDGGDMTYDVPRPLLEPPSPLVEFNQFTTRQLDRAIHRLPKSTPYRPDLEGLGEELRGKRAGFRPSSLHEELLQFIIEEWAQIPNESSPPPFDGSRLVVEETARLLDDHTHVEACLSFTQQAGELEEYLKGVMERISNLRVPKEPDLEKIHNAIDQCESLFSQLKKLQPSLASCNETSLSLLASLSTSPPPPPLLTSSLPHPPSPPSVKLTQLIEIWLFDLTTTLQGANLQLATKLRELREKETLTNTLHRHLQTLTHTLSAADQLIKEQDDVIEVKGHLQQCKEMHKQLSNQSDWIDQLVNEMQDYVTTNPQSQTCQSLLEQVQQIERDWSSVCVKLAAVSQLEPTLRVNMLRNVAMAIEAMENELPKLEVTVLKLDDIIAKQRKARSLVSKCRQLLSSLQTAEVNLLLTMSPPAGNHGDHVVQEVVGGVDHAQQQKQCKELQKDCKRILSELKTLSSLLATSHTLLERLTNEMQDLRVWIDDTKTILEMGERVGTAQHRLKYQAISQQLLAKQRHMESYQSLVSEVLLLSAAEKEKKEIEKEVLALYADWDTICQQCIPAGTLPLMSPTTPQSKFFQAPQEFDDPLQMVEWLILLDFKLQPERLVVGDYLHVRRTLRDLQLIEAELQAKEKVYNNFMKDVDFDPKTRPDIETESQFNDDQRDGSSSPITPMVEFNPQQGVNDKSIDRRMQRFGMESVQEQSGEEDGGNGMETPHVPELKDDFNKSSSHHSNNVTTATNTKFDWSNRYHSIEGNSSSPNQTRRFPPKQPSLPIFLTQASVPHTPSSSLTHSSTQPTLLTQTSLLSSLSSIDYGHSSLLSRQVSITSSITTSLAELLISGSPTASMPEDLYQLMLLWNGIKTAIGQKRQRLEQIRDLWKSFETKKEEFANFLTKAEGRLREFPNTIGQAMDMTVIQNEIETQKSFLEEIPDFERKLSVLTELGQNLATRYHADDSTTDLQDVLKDMNDRWTTVMESVSRHQPEVNLLSQQWAEFHSHYQSFHQWLRNMDTEMANLNPFISNMATVQMQLVKLKEIQEEVTAHEGVMDSVKLLSYKLQQEVGGSCHVNPAAIHSRLESMSRRWDHLLKLSQERHSALEESLTDKQQLLTRMADCLSWLQQAEQHMASQRPLGGDYYQVHDQYLAQKSFGQEVQEQVPKMEAVVQAGRSGLLDVQWPVGTPERFRMDSLRSEFLAVEKRWMRVNGESEEWGKLLESIHPEMETFQTLCAECGQRLSEVELRCSGMPPVANRVVMLTQQLEELREFEAGLVVVGNVLEKVISTQKKLVQLGAKVSSELSELVRRFHERWLEVKKRVTARYSAIDKAMVKYDPENLGVATLPRGWIREKTKNGTPYYVENKRGAIQQWQHPDLTQLYHQMEIQFNQPCYPNLAYPAALKLRALQKKTQLHLLETRIAMQTFEEDHLYNIYNSNKILGSSEMIMLCLGLYEQAERHPAVRTEPLYVNRAVELTASWIRDVYDITREGLVTCVSFQIAMVSLSHGRLEDKQRSLFRIMAKRSETVTLHQLADFLEHLVQIPQNVLQTQYCSVDSLDYHVQDCFKKFADETGQLGLPQFLSWIQTEPLPLSWLAVMHRVMASETTHHDIKCAVCRIGPPVSGFRYRCQQCHNFDMCQNCFWSGGTTHGHDRSKHYMEEYCVVRPSGDELRDFFRNLQRHMKKKKKKNPSTSEVLQEHAPQVIGDHSSKPPGGNKGDDFRLQQSPTTKQRHATVTPISVSESDSQAYGRRYTSPPPDNITHTNSSPSHRAQGNRQRDRSTTNATSVGGGDIDYSLCKLTEKEKNLSQTLNTLRKHRQSLTPDPLQNGGLPTVVNKPHPPPQGATSALHGRVKVLEEHNTKLESYITQLKTITDTGQHVDHTTSSNWSPSHQRAVGNSENSTHLTPRASPYAKRERKYHYITMATGSPSHNSSSSPYTTTAATTTSRQATMATGNSTHSNYVPINPAQQRIQPPALVRNSKTRSPAITLL